MAETKKDFEAALDHAQELFDSKDFAAAASAADDLLLAHRLTKLAQTAVVRGKALIQLLVKQIEDEEADNPTQESFGEAWDCLMLALRLDPLSEEAKDEVAKLQTFISGMPTE